LPHPFLDHAGPIAFAHRGGLERYPENTMAAFEDAVAVGFRYLETDVHVTADGVLLAFHDHVLDRVTDRAGIVAQLPWSDVREARLANGERPVRFEELLAAWPDVRINVEPKHDAAVDPLARALRDARALDRVCIGSLSGPRLIELRQRLGPEACTTLTPREVLALRLGSWRIPSLAGIVRSSGARCAQLPMQARGLQLVDRWMVRRAHQLGLPVHVWTINDATAMGRLLDLGVDGLMTDRPRVLRGVLERRGAWQDWSPR
jgi:glycerophosphoryl diester phosphodiesterase